MIQEEFAHAYFAVKAQYVMDAFLVPHRRWFPECPQAVPSPPILLVENKLHFSLDIDFLLS
jgi:hypothetical protein